MKEQYYIYKIINLIDEKQYIGKHIGALDDSYLGSGINIKAAIKKYGKENFKKEILYIANSEEEMNEKEKYYIKLYNAVEDPMFYNIAEGGEGGYVTKGYTEEQRLEVNKKISLAISGENHPNYGKHLTDEHKQKISDSLKEYWTDDKRKERSEKYKGENNPMYGKRHTAETIAKIKANTDFYSYRNEEYSKKMSLATSGEKNGNYGNKGEKAKNGKHVLMYDKNHNLIKEFNTKRLVLEFLGIKGHNLLNKAIKEKSLYKGYYWEQI